METAPLTLPRRARGIRVRPNGEALLMTALCLAATALQMARQPGVPSWNSIWQEDGAVFFSHAWKDPFFETIGLVYNNYLHVVPRIAAGFVALLPLKLAAFGMTFAAALIVSAVAVYIFYASAAVFESLWVRVALAVMVVLLPAGGYETNANLANVHWYLDYAAFWVFVANPRTRRGIALGAVIVAGAVLSDPLAGLLLPLVARRVWESRRDRAAFVIPGVWGVCLALQLAVGYFGHETTRFAPSHWADLPGIFALRVTGSLTVGDAFLGRFWMRLGYAFAYTTLVLVAAVIAYGFLKADRRRRLFVGECVFYALVTAIVPLMLRGTEQFLNRSHYSLNGSRYTVLPIMFLLGAVLQAFDVRDRRLSPAAWRYVQIGAAVFLAATVLTSFGQYAVRTSGPAWTTQLKNARRDCAARLHGARVPANNSLPAVADGLQTGRGANRTPPSDVRIGVSPSIPDRIPFAATIPCKDVLSYVHP